MYKHAPKAFGCMAVSVCMCVSHRAARVCEYRGYNKTIHFPIYLQVLMTFPFLINFNKLQVYS